MDPRLIRAILILSLSSIIPSTSFPAIDLKAPFASPTSVHLTWNHFQTGTNSISHYQLSWSNGHSTNSTKLTSKVSNRMGSFLMKSLQPDTQYTFQLTAIVSSGEPVSSNIVRIKTRVVPGTIRFLSVTNHSIQFQYISPNDPDVIRHQFRFTWRDPIRRKVFRRQYPPFPFATKPSTSYVYKIGSLKPNTKYLFRIQVIYKPSRLFFWPNDARFTIRTAAGRPSKPRPVVVYSYKNGRSIVTWSEPIDGGSAIIEYLLQARKQYNRTLPQESNWQNVYNGANTSWIIHGLQSGVEYLFRLRARNKLGWGLFSTSSAAFHIPEIVVKEPEVTQGPPLVYRFQSGSYLVKWNPPQEIAAAVLKYQLQISSLDASESNATWVLLYEGPKTSFVLTNITLGVTYEFKVRGFTSKWLAWSRPSAPFHLDEALENEGATNLAPPGIWLPDLDVVTVADNYPYESTIIDEQLLNNGGAGARKASTLALVMSVIGILLACLMFIVCAFCCLLKRHRKLQKKETFQLHNIGNGTTPIDLGNGQMKNSMLRFNDLYVSSLIDEAGTDDIPHFTHQQVELVSFLGSGCFGEVWEGHVVAVGSNEDKTNVAVKMLKKSSTPREVQDFLKEAKLMSTLHHKHIVELLGLCLDQEPLFMLQELLEGGDLLTFLRAARNPHEKQDGGHGNGKCAVGIHDLLDVCRQVGSGCAYLEQMHFIHRDIAARNCLVSTKCGDEETPRVCKLCDFGLTRDVYRNDYYKKEGEGLLPVRWMSQESLSDGVFSTQSDVWSFGVLMWEVFTLGQQPYPAMSNVDVFAFVSSGGRLPKPPICSDNLFSVMLDCWNFLPTDRPSFEQLSQILNSRFCDEMTSSIHTDMTTTAVYGSDDDYLYSKKASTSSAGLSSRESDDTTTDGQSHPPYLAVISSDISMSMSSSGFGGKEEDEEGE